MGASVRQTIPAHLQAARWEREFVHGRFSEWTRYSKPNTSSRLINRLARGISTTLAVTQSDRFFDCISKSSMFLTYPQIKHRTSEFYLANTCFMDGYRTVERERQSRQLKFDAPQRFRNRVRESANFSFRSNLLSRSKQSS